VACRTLHAPALPWPVIHYHHFGRSLHTPSQLSGAPRNTDQCPHTGFVMALEATRNDSLGRSALINIKRSGRDAGREAAWRSSSAHARTSSFWSSLATSTLHWAWFSSCPNTALSCHFYHGGYFKSAHLLQKETHQAGIFMAGKDEDALHIQRCGRRAPSCLRRHSLLSPCQGLRSVRGAHPGAVPSHTALWELSLGQAPSRREFTQW